MQSATGDCRGWGCLLWGGGLVFLGGWLWVGGVFWVGGGVFVRVGGGLGIFGGGLAGSIIGSFPEDRAPNRHNWRTDRESLLHLVPSARVRGGKYTPGSWQGGFFGTPFRGARN